MPEAILPQVEDEITALLADVQRRGLHRLEDALDGTYGVFINGGPGEKVRPRNLLPQAAEHTNYHFKNPGLHSSWGEGRQTPQNKYKLILAPSIEDGELLRVRSDHYSTFRPDKQSGFTLKPADRFLSLDRDLPRGLDVYLLDSAEDTHMRDLLSTYHQAYRGAQRSNIGQKARAAAASIRGAAQETSTSSYNRILVPVRNALAVLRRGYHGATTQQAH